MSELKSYTYKQNTKLTQQISYVYLCVSVHIYVTISNKEKRDHEFEREVLRYITLTMGRCITFFMMHLSNSVKMCYICL